MKNIKNRTALVTLSPLTLLVFILATSSIKDRLSGVVAYPDVAVYRYFCIPLIGLSLGLTVSLAIIRKELSLPLGLVNFLEGNTRKIITTATVVFALFFSTVLVLRYSSFHTSVIELGVYDNKVWQTSSAPSIFKSIITAATVHIQPLLILYALFYKIYASPIILLILQVVTVTSSVIPLYLIARDTLKEPIWILSTTLIYLLYPPVEFNSVADFHPDHFYIPLSLWAFYFALRNNYWAAVLMIGIGALAKEPLWLGAASFGIYLVLAKRCYFVGFSSTVFFFLVFLLAIFYVQPTLDPHLKALQADNVFQTEDFSHIGKLTKESHLFIAGVYKGLLRKLLFFFCLLLPLLFLPLLSWKEFLPAIPFLAITFLSANPEHSNAESHYTAGIIAPTFVALLYSLEKINKTLGGRYVSAVMTLLVVSIVTLNIAKSPAPFSINFWNQHWSETWNYNVYKSGAHEKVIKKAISLIPRDFDKTIVAQSNINHSRLAHRYNYSAFPKRWEDADYIILDTERPLMISDHVDEELFQETLQKIENNPRFTLEFKEDGVSLYKRSR